MWYPCNNFHVCLIQVGYGDNFYNELGSAEAAEEYIDSVLTHVQVNYCHSSLTSSVLVERLDDIIHYEGYELSADSASLQSMYDNTVNDIGDADLMVYFGWVGSTYTFGGGIT